MNILKIKSRKLTLLLVATMDKRIVMTVTNVLHWSIYKCVLWLLCLIWYEKWISGGQRLQGCMRTVKVPGCDTISVRGEGYERGTTYGQKNKKGNCRSGSDFIWNRLVWSGCKSVDSSVRSVQHWIFGDCSGYCERTYGCNEDI